MLETENTSEPGAAWSASGAQAQDAHSIGDHCRQIHDDAIALGTALRDATVDVQRYVSEQVEQRPYTTLGVAAAVGYVLGGGLPSRLTGLLLGSATRLAMALAVGEISARLSPGAPPATDRSESSQEPVGGGKERP